MPAEAGCGDRGTLASLAGLPLLFARASTLLAEGRTVVLISHRLGSCRLADRILVLEEGRLAEEGTRAALLAAGGRYASLLRMQVAWYRGATSDRRVSELGRRSRRL